MMACVSRVGEVIMIDALGGATSRQGPLENGQASPGGSLRVASVACRGGKPASRGSLRTTV